MESLSRVLLLSIHGYETKHGSGPTPPELAADLGIPEDFGHHHLVERLKRQVALGRITHHGGHFHLTEAGRNALGEEPASPLSPPTEATQQADSLNVEPVSTTP